MNKNAKPKKSSELVPVSMEIDTDNEFEKDLFVYMPKVIEIINEGRDITSSVSELCQELGLSRRRFERIYNAVKKQQTDMTYLRAGEDQKLTLVFDVDKQIAQLAADRKELVDKRRKAEEKEKNKEELSISDMSILATKIHDFYRMISNIDQLTLKCQERKAKLLGVEIQRRVVITTEAEKLLKEMMETGKKAQEPIDVEAEELETI